MHPLIETFTAGNTAVVGGLETSAASDYDADAELPVFSTPRYYYHEQADTLRLAVHFPDVDPTAIELEVNGPDLTITAARDRSPRFERRSSALAEPKHDYRLRLRLGFDLAYAAMRVGFHAGRLTIMIPKEQIGRRKLIGHKHHIDGYNQDFLPEI